MLNPDPNAVIQSLSQAASLVGQLGNKEHAEALALWSTQLAKEELTFKLLRGPVAKAMNDAGVAIQDTLYDDYRKKRPGREKQAKEHERIWADFLRLLYPPEWPEMDISKFSGSNLVKEKKVGFKGDPGAVRHIVEGSIHLITRYSQLLGTANFSAAYALTDAGLRSGMTLDKFITEHEKAAEKWGGPALEFIINEFCYLYADEEARKESAAREGWPKLTPKENRCCRVIGFWIRDGKARTGCAGGLWVAHETDGYKIAKFDFWRP